MPESKKILIIDDEADLCLLLKEYFVRKHFDVTISHDLNEGKTLMQQMKPDILFLDNNLPGGTGWNSAPLIASNFPSTYIVLISAYGPSVPVMPAGARFHIIEKPISFSELDKQFSKF